MDELPYHRLDNAQEEPLSNQQEGIKLRLSTSEEQVPHGRARRRGSDVDHKDQSRELAELGLGAGKVNEEEGWGAVANLDIFFLSMYKYYCHKGFVPAIAAGATDVITLGFTVIFTTFLLSWVNWDLLWTCHDEESCHAFRYYLRHPLDNAKFMDGMVFIWFLLFMGVWLWRLVSYASDVKDAMQMKQFYNERLNISERELQTMEWHEVVERLLELQRSGAYTIAINNKGFTAQDIACRIMRKENYLIALLNKEVLPLRLPFPKLPFGLDKVVHPHDDYDEYNSAVVGDRSRWRQPALNDANWSFFRLSRRLYFTPTLEWSFQFCVLDHMFNQNFSLRRSFRDDRDALRKRFLFAGLLYTAMMPFVLVFMVIHFFLKNAQEWHTQKNYLGPRRWDHLSQWIYREFNELPHIFQRRLNLSYEHAGNYAKRFHNPAMAMAARCVAFISGSFVAVLLLITIVDDSFLFHITLHDRNLFWYLGIFSTIFAASIGLTPIPVEASMDADEMMERVKEHTHYFPEPWRGRCTSHRVRDEFLSMFKYKAQLFLEEVLVVVLAPYTLCVALPTCADEIVDFIANNTTNIDGLGSVCRYSMFDFDLYGDERFGAPAQGSARDRTKDGKLEKSFLNFKLNHPQWECGAKGDQFIGKLEAFQQEQIANQQREQLQALQQLSQSSVLHQHQSPQAEGGVDGSGQTAPQTPHTQQQQQQPFFANSVADSLQLSSLALSSMMQPGASALGANRTVESILQSAMRESTRQSHLGDVLNRRGAFAGQSALRNGTFEASFFWLDRLREEQEPLQGDQSV